MDSQGFNITFIDMGYFSDFLVQSFDTEKSKQLALYFIPNYKEDLANKTHLCLKCASVITKIAVKDFKKANYILQNKNIKK